MKAGLFFSSLAVLAAYTATAARPEAPASAIVRKVPGTARPHVSVPAGYFQIGQPIVFQVVGGSSGSGVLTRYALTDPAGKIIRLADSPLFPSGDLPAGEYSIYAVTYTDDNTIQHLTANDVNRITDVTAGCLVVSAPLSVHVMACAPACVPAVIAHKIR